MKDNPIATPRVIPIIIPVSNFQIISSFRSDSLSEIIGDSLSEIIGDSLSEIIGDSLSEIIGDSLSDFKRISGLSRIHNHIRRNICKFC